MIHDRYPYVVAEIGCNHKGDMAIARDLIETAARFAKADFAKFQKRCNRELLTAEEYNAPHPNPVHSYGSTYGEHREFLEFDVHQHRQLKRWCEEFGIGYSTSVWDMTSAREMVDLAPSMLKVPSACNLHFPMLEFLARNFSGEIHISLGMTTPEEQEQIVRLMESLHAQDRVVLYACTSGYPVPFEQVHLLEVTRLRELYGHRVKAIGERAEARSAVRRGRGRKGRGADDYPPVGQAPLEPPAVVEVDVAIAFCGQPVPHDGLGRSHGRVPSVLSARSRAVPSGRRYLGCRMVGAATVAACRYPDRNFTHPRGRAAARVAAGADGNDRAA